MFFADAHVRREVRAIRSLAAFLCLGGASAARFVPAVTQKEEIVRDFTLVCILALALIFCAGSARSDCAPSPSDLISWWPGEGTAVDLRYGNDGVAIGGVTYGSGMVGEAFRFDGAANQHVLVPSHTTIDAQTLTLAAWVNPATFPNDFPMVVRRDRNPGTTLYALAVTSTGAAHVNIGGAGVVAGTIPLGSWTHLAATYDGSSIRLYVNGSEVGASSQSTTIGTSDQDLVIGGWKNEPSRAFDGSIDEVMLWSRALSAVEIAALWAAGSEGLCHLDPVAATTFYSVDIDNGMLVRVDGSDGEVTPLQTLEGEFVDVDLASDATKIYVLNSMLPDSVALLALDRETHALIWRVRLSWNGSPVRNAEGVTVKGDGIWVSFASNLECLGCSDAIGRVLEDGSVVDVAVFVQATSPPIPGDGDGLCARGDGRLIWWDTDPPHPAIPFNDSYRLAEVVTPPAASYSQVGYHQPYIRIHDIEFGVEGELWGINETLRRLYRIRPEDGALLGSFRYQSDYRLMGLALETPAVGAVGPSGERGASLCVSPSPSRGGVTITCEVEPCQGEIRIVDVLGRVVWTAHLTGHAVEWNGRSRSGLRVPSGVYYANLRRGRSVESRAFVLLD
jgi:hypothetical protein